MEKMGFYMDRRTIDTMNINYRNILRRERVGQGQDLLAMTTLSAAAHKEVTQSRSATADKARLLERISQLAHYSAQNSHVYVRGEKFRAIGGRIETYNLPKGNIGIWKDSVVEGMETWRAARDADAASAATVIGEAAKKLRGIKGAGN